MVEPTCAKSRLLYNIRELLADAFLLRPEHFSAGQVNDRNDALARVVLGGAKLKSLPDYPYVTLTAGNMSQVATVAEQSASTYGERRAAVDIIFRYCNPASLADNDNPYIDAQNFINGVMEDDIWRLTERDELQNRPRLYKFCIESTDAQFGPELSDESTADDKGVILQPVWVAGFSMTVFGFERLAERRS